MILAVFVAAALICGSLLLSAHLLAPEGPREEHNPSFVYGEKVLVDIYGKPTTSDSITTECRRAIEQRSDHPEPFHLAEAVAGCKYQEWHYDN